MGGGAFLVHSKVELLDVKEGAAGVPSPLGKWIEMVFDLMLARS